MTGSEFTNSCGICFDTLNKSQWQAHSEKKLPCGHAFGKSCIERWIEKRPNCPLCRANMPYERSLAERVAERVSGWARTRMIEIYINKTIEYALEASAFLVAYKFSGPVFGPFEINLPFAVATSCLSSLIARSIRSRTTYRCSIFLAGTCSSIFAFACGYPTVALNIITGAVNFALPYVPYEYETVIV